MDSSAASHQILAKALSAGMIDAGQLAVLLQRADSDDRPLDQVMVELGLIDDQVRRALLSSLSAGQTVAYAASFTDGNAVAEQPNPTLNVVPSSPAEPTRQPTGTLVAGPVAA